MKRLCILIFLFLSGCGVNEISETEIGVLEPSQALFNENTDEEH